MLGWGGCPDELLLPKVVCCSLECRYPALLISRDANGKHHPAGIWGEAVGITWADSLQKGYKMTVKELGFHLGLL